MLNMTRMGLVPALVLSCLVSTGCNRMRGLGPASDPKTDDEKVFYALGADIGKGVDVFSLSPAELEMVKAGLTDTVTKQPLRVDFDKTRPKIFEMAQKRQQARSEGEKKRGKEALDKAAKESGAHVLPSGIVVKTLRAGTGASPVPTDTVKVNYEGRLIDGTVFDSSAKQNKPAEFSLQGVVPCWTQGLQQMKVGEKAQLTCPSETGYGDRGSPPKIPGGSTLVFDIELLDLTHAAAPAPAPAPAVPGPAGPAKK